LEIEKKLLIESAAQFNEAWARMSLDEKRRFHDSLKVAEKKGARRAA